MNLKGTKTEANLQTAFAGESQARNKYTYYASKARKDGYQQIAALFEETAANEKEHAKLWFKLLCGGQIPSTEENLLDAAQGENYEWTDMYDTFAKEADEEGDRNSPRGPLSQAAGKCQKRPGLLPGGRPALAVCQLRPYRHRQGRAGDLPGLQSSASLFPSEGRELLI